MILWQHPPAEHQNLCETIEEKGCPIKVYQKHKHHFCAPPLNHTSYVSLNVLHQFHKITALQIFQPGNNNLSTTAAITAGSDNQFECLPVQGDVWSVSMKAWLSPTLALFTEKHFWKNSLTPKCFAHCTNEKSTEGGGSSLYVKKVTCEGML